MRRYLVMSDSIVKKKRNPSTVLLIFGALRRDRVYVRECCVIMTDQTK